MTIDEALAEVRGAADLLAQERFDADARELREACACLTGEIQTLHAALATPEVYAGLVTEVLEDERDRAIQELREAREIIAKFPEAMREIDRKDQT
jgi:hypothetical protein